LTDNTTRARDGNLVDRLPSAGHDVDLLAEPHSDFMDHAGAVVLCPDGTLEGAHDPRANGGAAARHGIQVNAHSS